jgi:hypothetical protein
MHLTRGELWVLGSLAAEGYVVDVFTDVDFHQDGLDAAQYACLSTHPEYWTTQMYDNLKAYLDAGGSLAYLGGNGIFESGVYAAGNTEMAFRAGVDGGPRISETFRALSPPRPEWALLGVATERCGVPGSPYEVLAPDHSLFAGTGLTSGDLIGGFGYNTGFGNGQASAWEVDTSNGPGAVGITVDCAMEDAAVPPSSLPAGLTILARGTSDAGGSGAEMVHFDHPGGGLVFSAGSLTFGGSLVADAALQQIMRNVLAAAGV